MAALLSSQLAHAERKYGMAGCGLGSIIMKPSSSQSSAATTNGSFYSQLFGITSGTSNCPSSGGGEAALRQEQFFVANFSELSKEIAQGGGQSVTGFASVLGCEATHTQAVAAALKDNYQTIFAEPGAVAAFDAATESLRDDGEIKSHCSLL